MTQTENLFLLIALALITALTTLLATASAMCRRAYAPATSAKAKGRQMRQIKLRLGFQSMTPRQMRGKLQTDRTGIPQNAANAFLIPQIFPVHRLPGHAGFHKMTKRAKGIWVLIRDQILIAVRII